MFNYRTYVCLCQPLYEMQGAGTCAIICGMRKLEADIKAGIYKNLYVLFGPQSYNRKRYAKALCDLFLPEGDTMNLTSFYGKDTDIAEVASLAVTLPFFAAKRVIVLENTGMFLRSCEELCDLIGNIPDSCVIIFSEEKIDNRLKQTKLAKSAGTIAEFDTLSEKEMKDWILRRLAKEHRQITGAALVMFMQRCSDDLWQTGNELEKIISYTFGKDGIRPEDVDAVIPPPPQDAIFEMIDAILSGNESQALSLYADLLRLQSEPMGILTLLRDQLRIVMNVGKMNAEHMGYAEMAKVLAIREGRARMALPAARKSSTIKLRECVNMCADTEERIKSGLIDPKVGLETLLITLCNTADDRRN